jgi:uracil-DNA glycosylase
MFTGDRSGDFLYRALYETGFASQPESRDRGDGLRLNDCYISAPVRCVPPDNRPLPDEIRQCSAYLAREINLLKRIAVVVTLGRIGFDAYRGLQGIGALPFGHGFVHRLNPVLIASYHPSQQNTQTGRLTPEMLRHVFETARSFLGGETRLEPGDSVES